MVRVLLLDFAGMMASIVVGLAVIFFSKSFALQNFLLLLFFLLVSVAATKYRYEEKKEKGLYEHERSWQNVVSNGSIPALCCLGFYVYGSPAWIAAFVASIAGAISDKFGSELGVLSDKPISLGNLKPVKQGKSGAISLLGTFLSFAGALLVGVAAYVLYRPDPFSIFAIAAIGFIGGIVDSVFGVFEERGIGNKSTTNLLCTIGAALLGYYFLKF